jgi:AraC family transcriptional regulator, positive regulator of tynA and feaB
LGKALKANLKANSNEGCVVKTCQVIELPVRSHLPNWNVGQPINLNDHLPQIAPLTQEPSSQTPELTTLGAIQIIRLRFGMQNPDVTWLNSDQLGRRSYSLILQARGLSTLGHYGHTAILREGDVILCNNTAPMNFDQKESSEVVVLRIPNDLLKEHLPSPDLFCGRHLPASEGLTSAITTLILSLCAKPQTSVPFEFQDRIASHVLDMIATSYAIAFESKITSSSSVVDGLYAKVKLFIEQHLRDPNLSPCTIAEKLKLSSRYLRMVFATGDETASAYILRRRLEECARQIADPSWRGHSITQIAFAWGFNSAPHFSRSFRARFGMSPRHYRRVELASKRAHA